MTAPKEAANDLSGYADDLLSDVLQSVRMTGAAFTYGALDGPPIASQWPREDVLSAVGGRRPRRITYHIVTEGRCFAQAAGGEVIELRAGQVAILPKGDHPHFVIRKGDPRSCSGRPGLTHFAPPELRYALRSSDDEAPAKLVSGSLACEGGPSTLLVDNLPRILVGDCNQGAGLAVLRALTNFVTTEAAALGGGRTILGRLAELMFIEVVRQHVERLPGQDRTWLSGLRDQSIGRALALMHRNTSHAWSLNGLAREVGLSRSEFAERFTAFVGMPPMHYLARWRMQRAAGLLKNSVNIASVANEVGYSSEASFSRAFKKIVGLSPSHWRGGELARVA